MYKVGAHAGTTLPQLKGYVYGDFAYPIVAENKKMTPYQIAALVYEVCPNTRSSATFVRMLLAYVAWQTQSIVKPFDYKVWKAEILYSLGNEAYQDEMAELDRKGHLSGLGDLCDFHFLDAGTVLYRDSLLSVDGNNLRLAANALDEEYAYLVKGAMVSTSMQLIWTPKDEMAHSKIDDESFNNVMWMYLQGYIKQKLEEEKVHPKRGDPNRRQIADIVRKVKDQMKHVWMDAQNFGISPEVLMVEVEVMHRLHVDGVFSDVKNIHKSIRFMRRDPQLKYQFASAVGKRMLTERLIARGRTSIIEHHRSVAWGEREYHGLYTLVSPLAGYIAGELTTKDFVDHQIEPVPIVA